MPLPAALLPLTPILFAWSLQTQLPLLARPAYLDPPIEQRYLREAHKKLPTLNYQAGTFDPEWKLLIAGGAKSVEVWSDADFPSNSPSELWKSLSAWAEEKKVGSLLFAVQVERKAWASLPLRFGEKFGNRNLSFVVWAQDNCVWVATPKSLFGELVPHLGARLHHVTDEAQPYAKYCGDFALMSLTGSEIVVREMHKAELMRIQKKLDLLKIRVLGDDLYSKLTFLGPDWVRDLENDVLAELSK
jgi:hypothetical protein